MNKIKMKVTDYDPESNSIIVAFTSDVSKKSIDEVETFAYQPTMYEEPNNVDIVLKEIARTGMYIVEDQLKSEQFKEEKILDKYYAELVGKEFEYDVEDLQTTHYIEVEAEEDIVEDVLKEIFIDEEGNVESK